MEKRQSANSAKDQKGFKHFTLSNELRSNEKYSTLQDFAKMRKETNIMKILIIGNFQIYYFRVSFEISGNCLFWILKSNEYFENIFFVFSILKIIYVQ